MTKHSSDKRRAERRGGKFTRRDAETGQFLSGSMKDTTVRRQPDAGRVSAHGRVDPVSVLGADRVSWPSGEGHEIGTISGSIDDLLEALRGQMSRGAVREPVAYGEDGTEMAIVIGQPSQPLASLVADETLAPGVVGVIADIGADPAAIAVAVEERLGRGFEVRRHAL